MPRHFANWIDAYLDYTSIQESPRKIHYWTAVWGIAAALRRKVWFDQVLFQWIPNMFVVVVAPPGVVSKSTTAGIIERMLRKIDGIHFGPKVITWQELAVRFADAIDEYKIGEGLDAVFHPMSCLTIAASELGSFLDSRDSKMLDVLTDLWDGKLEVWDKATKTQGCDEIQNHCISFHACTTPAWLQRNIDPIAMQGGFFSRCVFVYAEDKRHITAYLKNKIPSLKKYREQERKLIEDLKQIAKITGEYTLTKEAEKYADEWYNNIWKEYKNNGENDRIKGAYARRQTMVHKVSMIIQAAKGDDRTITLETVQEAIIALDEVRYDSNPAIGRVDEALDTRQARKIIEYVFEKGATEKSKLYSTFWRVMTKREYEAAMKAAIAGKILRETQKQGKLYVTLGQNFEDYDERYSLSEDSRSKG